MCESFAAYQRSVQESEIGTYDRVVHLEARAEGKHGRILSEAASEIAYLRDSLRNAEKQSAMLVEEGTQECQRLRRSGQELEEQWNRSLFELQQFKEQEASLRQDLAEHQTRLTKSDESRRAECARLEQMSTVVSNSLRTELWEANQRLAG